MNEREDIANYVKQIAGEAQRLRPVRADELRGLPAFMAMDGLFFEWEFMGCGVVFAKHRGEMPELNARELKARAELLVEHFRRPVAFVFPALASHQRKRLMELGVPFMVPGLQLFIPPFMSLTEQFQRVAKAKTLSAAAQLTVLYQLLRKPLAGAPLRQWAEWLNYSAMTLTKVRDELVAAGLCEREPGAKPRGLNFLFEGRQLWDAAWPVLRSPARRQYGVRFAARPRGLIAAGLSALAGVSLLQDDPVPTFACRESEWREWLAARAVRVVESPDEAEAHVEPWRYDPALLARNGVADPLSLFLSLKNMSDDRVRLAADELLERVEW